MFEGKKEFILKNIFINTAAMWYVADNHSINFHSFDIIISRDQIYQLFEPLLQNKSTNHRRLKSFGLRAG
jgi:hypothetical protein